MAEIDLVWPIYYNKYSKEIIKKMYLYVIHDFNSNGTPKRVWPYYIGDNGHTYCRTDEKNKALIYPNSYYFFVSPFYLDANSQKKLRREDFEDKIVIPKVRNPNQIGQKSPKIELPVIAPGDIIFRRGKGHVSQLVVDLTYITSEEKSRKSKYSHCGIICLDDQSKTFKVVDSMSDRGPEGRKNLNSVKMITIDEFISHAIFSAIYRYNGDREKARETSKWALKQTKIPEYNFNIFYDKVIFGDKNVYCSVFVYYCYISQNIKLTDILNLKSAANRENTLKAMAKYVKNAQKVGLLFTYDKILQKIPNDERFVNSSGNFIAPRQLADSNKMKYLFTIGVPAEDTSVSPTRLDEEIRRMNEPIHFYGP